MMIAFITIKSSLIPLIEGLCAQSIRGTGWKLAFIACSASKLLRGRAKVRRAP